MKNKILKNIQNKVQDYILRKSYTGLVENLLSSNDNWNEKNYLKAYQLSLYTNRALNKRSEKVGQIEFQLFKNDKKIIDDKLLGLLNKPNKFFTGREFWALYQKYKDIFGEAYIWLKTDKDLFSAKQITELHLFRPDTMSYEFNKEEGIKKYTRQKSSGGTQDYKPEEIIRSFYPDPANPLKGESLMLAGAKAISTEIQLSQYQANILKNGGRVESIFKFKTGNLSRTQLEEIKDKYKEEYGSAQKSGMPLFLGGDADYQSVGLKPDELAYLESKNLNLNDICIMTGVPKTILASVDNIKYDNARVSERIFIKETIKPLLVNLTTKLNEFLFPDDLTLHFVDPTPEDKEQKRKDLETADKVYALTINEKREQLGLEPIKNGDEILVPMNLLPLDSKDQSNNNKKKSINKNDKDFDHPLKDSYVRRKYHELYIKRADKREAEMVKVLNKYFKEQSKRIIEQLEIQKIYRRKNLVDDVFNLELELNLAKETFLPLLEKYLIAAGIDAVKFSGSEFNFNISGEIASWLSKKTDIFAEQINNTTFKKLQKELEESLVEDEDRKKLINRIQNTYGDISKKRAATIARTEIQGVSQKGAFEGYKQAGIPIKIWVAVMDDKTRDSHASLDGEEVPINQSFSNGLQFPGDPDGSASEVVNCRCTL